MTFHHVDPTTKTDGIAEMAHKGVPISVFMAELKKCVVMCKRCHNELHGE